MAWFPAATDWNDFYLPPGIQQELEDLETIFRNVPQPPNQNHPLSSNSQSDAPMVDATTLDPHSLIAPPTNHNTGYDNQLVMNLDSPFFSNTYQPQGMTPVFPTEQPLEESVKPKPSLKAQNPRSQRKSPQSQHIRTEGRVDATYRRPARVSTFIRLPGPGMQEGV
ncbi:unnamed protein product [Aspergillus oryzae RIB40]|uniref:DNA, SC003 n=2 Tax=Aspergillus oryzae TaxID=5062 RepID=Q2UIY6_ASPOR|nr:unnamed protein product [Aspergillus oryzae RIB40]EIT81652.1 hypothetical protein Ao3042_01885 [Aspergillus oryzae 3.042]KDE76584.1 hypothetical protein AO1008_02413 [Aspergillus oryzae 100-8]BAE58479.1 unnamed protein product [Aspergillus oryzae RIB40]|eukprot:EIT81652.1 hypothetical protein Ao3042_01885 [Aspergillus oryzae 3.042]